MGEARVWGATPLTMLYLTRFANLATYLLMAAAAVRIAPIQKWTLAMVALVPMSVYLAASLLGERYHDRAITLDHRLGPQPGRGRHVADTRQKRTRS